MSMIRYYKINISFSEALFLPNVNFPTFFGFLYLRVSLPMPSSFGTVSYEANVPVGAADACPMSACFCCAADACSISACFCCTSAGSGPTTTGCGCCYAGGACWPEALILYID
jgi:hypothetical protein